ncbi:MAG: carboxypeptidase-like regulatory domain-containing protein [Desulfobaccales bacterium]
MPGTFSYAAATNTVTVTGGASGSPADFASFVAADRAGAGTSLLAAWSPNSNTKALTYQVRPVEKLALLISFAVAGKTAETDYIFITGTDWLGAAQTESINVSAGNGSYVSTKYWRSITNIDCSDNPAGGGTVWANGTVAVTQPIWGVIWDKGNSQYQLDCFFYVGDGSTSTYFADVSKQIVISEIGAGFWNGTIQVRGNATLRVGAIEDAVNKYSSSGCSVRWIGASATGIDCGNGSVYILSSQLSGATRTYILPVSSNASNYLRIWNSILTYNMELNSAYYSDLYNVRIEMTNSAALNTVPYCTINNVSCIGGPNGLRHSLVSLTAKNVEIKGMSGAAIVMGTGLDIAGRDLYLMNCTLDNWTFSWDATCINACYRQNTINLHVTDKNGNNITGATVTLKDKNANTVFSDSTGADGKIAEQTVSRGYYDRAHGDTLQDYGPHTLTITKAGYQDYTDVITIDRKMDLELALSFVRTSPTNLGLVPLGIKQVAI